MVYITDNKQDAVVESILLTTEKILIALRGADHTDSNQASEVIYFQIED